MALFFSSRVQAALLFGSLMLSLRPCHAQLRSVGYFSTGNSSDIREARALAFSPDSELLAVADAGTWGTTAEVYEVSTGRQISKLTVHPSRIHVLTFSGDGTRMVTGLQDGRVVSWATDDWRQVSSLQPHNVAINCLDLSSDGKSLVTGYEDGSITVMNLEKGVITSRLEGHQHAVLSIELSPNGMDLVSAGNDGIIVWDLASGSKRVIADGASSNGCRSIAIVDDGAIIAGALFNSGDIRLWDIRSGNPAGMLAGHEDEVTQLAAATDSGQLVSGSADGTVCVWSVEERKCLSSSSATGSSVQSVAVSKDGAMLASGTHSGSVVVLVNNVPRGYLRTNQYASWGLSLGHNGSLMSACSGSPEYMQEIYSEFAFGADVGTGSTRQDGIKRVSFSEYAIDGKLRVLAGEQSALVQSKKDDGTWQETNRVTTGSEIKHIGLSSDGTLLMTVSSGTVAFWETGTGRMRTSVKPRQIEKACLSNDGRVAVVADSKQFTVISTVDGEVLWTQTVEAIDTKGRPAYGTLKEMCFTSCGHLVVCVWDSIQVWDLTKRTLVASRPHDHQCHYDSLVGCAGNRLAVIANKDVDPGARSNRGYAIELISVPENPGKLQTLAESVIPKSEEGGTRRLFVSADGNRLASTQGNFIRLWDLDPGKNIEPATVTQTRRFDSRKQAELKSHIEALKDPLIDDETRRKVCKRIEALGDEAASSVNEIAAVLRGGEGDSNYLLLEILGECGPEAVDVLMDFVEGRDRTLNGAAVSKLRRIGPGAEKAWSRVKLVIESDYAALTGPQLDQREYDWRRSRLENCLRAPVDLGVPAANAIPLLSQIASPHHSIRLRRDRSNSYAVAVAVNAMKEIAKYGESAGAAVPSLSKLAEECMSKVPPRDFLHQEALVTLAAIGPEAKSAEPVLRAILASKAPPAVTCHERAKAVLRRFQKVE